MANSVEYAEQTLGVHAAWQELQELMQAHEHATDFLLDHKRLAASIEDEIESVKGEIINEAWAEPDIKSGAERDRLIQKLTAENPRMTELHADHRSAENEVAVAKARLADLSLKIRGYSARLNELGGLLFFYGVAKMPRPATPTPTEQ